MEIQETVVRLGKKLLCIARSDDRVLSRCRIGADARSCYDHTTTTARRDAPLVFPFVKEKLYENARRKGGNDADVAEKRVKNRRENVRRRIKMKSCEFSRMDFHRSTRHQVCFSPPVDVQRRTLGPTVFLIIRNIRANIENGSSGVSPANLG